MENGTEIKSADLKVSHVVQHDLKTGMPREGKRVASISVTMNMSGGTTPLWAQFDMKTETAVTIRPAKRPVARGMNPPPASSTSTKREKKDEKKK